MYEGHESRCSSRCSITLSCVSCVSTHSPTPPVVVVMSSRVESTDERMLLLFRECDIDGSGYIGIEEVSHAFNRTP